MDPTTPLAELLGVAAPQDVKVQVMERGFDMQPYETLSFDVIVSNKYPKAKLALAIYKEVAPLLRYIPIGIGECCSCCTRLNFATLDLPIPALSGYPSGPKASDFNIMLEAKSFDGNIDTYLISDGRDCFGKLLNFTPTFKITKMGEVDVLLRTSSIVPKACGCLPAACCYPVCPCALVMPECCCITPAEAVLKGTDNAVVAKTDLDNEVHKQVFLGSDSKRTLAINAGSEKSADSLGLEYTKKGQMEFNGHPDPCCYTPSCGFSVEDLVPAEVLAANEALAKADEAKGTVKAALAKEKWVKVKDPNASWRVSFRAKTTSDEKAGALLYVLVAYTERFMRN